MEWILVLRTLGAPERRLLRSRRGRDIEQAEPEPVPTSRATIIRPDAFADVDQAEAWLAQMRADEDKLEAEMARALAVLNRALHAHRAARADVAARDVTREAGLVARMGFGSGDLVAEGRFTQAWEIPRTARAVKRTMEAPDQRFAALLSGRESPLACEELVLRARADADAGRTREAALQARIALESLLSEMKKLPESRREALDQDRHAVGQAANAALRGPVGPDAAARVEDAIGRMEAALRAHRVDHSG